MSKELTNPKFDYSLVDKDTKSKLIWYESELSRIHKRAFGELLEHGRTLYEVQQLLANYSGGIFLAWLASRGISKSSAYRQIDVHLGFERFPNWENIEVSAAYVLAKNEEAKKQALTLTKRGVKITHAMAKDLVASASPEPPWDEEEEFETPQPPKGRQRAAQEPKRQLDRSAWYKQFDSKVSPLVKLVDKIAREIGEMHGKHHRAVKAAMEKMGDEMASWMEVE
jgi:hypothetical protein